jgi:hypothetical protein
MFRNNVSDVSLFDSHTGTGPRPSFRPAVEALEERVVLNGDMMMDSPAPAPQQLTGADQYALQLLVFAQQLNLNLQAHPTLHNLRLTNVVETQLRAQINFLGMRADFSQDPQLIPIIQAFYQVDDVILAQAPAIKKAATLSGIQHRAVNTVLENLEGPLAPYLQSFNQGVNQVLQSYGIQF